MNDYQENLQVEQTEPKPKRKKKTIQERLDRALELKAKTEKQLAAIQKRLDGYNKQVEELQVIVHELDEENLGMKEGFVVGSIIECLRIGRTLRFIGNI